MWYACKSECCSSLVLVSTVGHYTESPSIYIDLYNYNLETFIRDGHMAQFSNCMQLCEELEQTVYLGCMPRCSIRTLTEVNEGGLCYWISMHLPTKQHNHPKFRSKAKYGSTVCIPWLHVFR